jgi:hypothetical protein
MTIPKTSFRPPGQKKTPAQTDIRTRAKIKGQPSKASRLFDYLNKRLDAIANGVDCSCSAELLVVIDILIDAADDALPDFDLEPDTDLEPSLGYDAGLGVGFCDCELDDAERGYVPGADWFADDIFMQAIYREGGTGDHPTFGGAWPPETLWRKEPVPVVQLRQVAHD